MSEHRHIPEPGEMVYAPQPSWAPGLLRRSAPSAWSAASTPPASSSRPFIYAIVGAIFVLAAFRSLVRGAIRDYFRLPRKQRVRGAALPVETITAPPRS